MKPILKLKFTDDDLSDERPEFMFIGEDTRLQKIASVKLISGMV